MRPPKHEYARGDEHGQCRDHDHDHVRVHVHVRVRGVSRACRLDESQWTGWMARSGSGTGSVS